MLLTSSAFIIKILLSLPVGNVHHLTKNPAIFLAEVYFLFRAIVLDNIPY